MSYQVRMTAKAEQDVDAVLAWYRDQSAIPAGGKWLGRLLEGIDRLERMPERCGLATEAADIGREIRELRIGRGRSKHRLLFEIRGKTVFILRIWHSARDAVARDDLAE